MIYTHTHIHTHINTHAHSLSYAHTQYVEEGGSNDVVLRTVVLIEVFLHF